MSPESWAAPTEAMGYRSASLQPKKHQRRNWVPELAEPIPMASAIDSRGRSPAPTQFFRGSVIESSVADSESQYGGFRTAPTRANAARSTQDAQRPTNPSGLIDDHAAVRESPARKGKGKTKGKSKGEKGGKGKGKDADRAASDKGRNDEGTGRGKGKEKSRTRPPGGLHR